MSEEENVIKYGKRLGALVVYEKAIRLEMTPEQRENRRVFLEMSATMERMAAELSDLFNIPDDKISDWDNRVYYLQQDQHPQPYTAGLRATFLEKSNTNENDRMFV